MEKEYPHLVPVDLGSMGYDGEESIYVSDAVLQQALDAEGLNLDYYRGGLGEENSAQAPLKTTQQTQTHAHTHTHIYTHTHTKKNTTLAQRTPHIEM